MILNLHRKEVDIHKYICLISIKYLLFLSFVGWMLKQQEMLAENTANTKIQVSGQLCQKGVINDFCANHLMSCKRLGGLENSDILTNL